MKNKLMEMVTNHYVKKCSSKYARRKLEEIPSTIFEYFYELKSGEIGYTSDERKVAELKDEIQILLRTCISGGKVVIERIDDNVVISEEQIAQEISNYYNGANIVTCSPDSRFFIESCKDFFYVGDGMVKKIMNNYDRLFLKNNPRPIYLAFRIEKEIYIKKIEMKDWF